jgi:hypothetical protein
MVIDWYSVTLQSLQGLWQGFLGFLPLFVGAIVVFVIGWYVSVGFGKLVTEVLKRLKINQFFERGVWKEALIKADLKIDVAGFVGGVFKWILVIVFLLAAVEIVGFTQFAGFIKDVVAYLPNVIVAALIFVVTVIIADIVAKVGRVAVEGAAVGYGHLVEVILRWSIWVFAILAILMQLRIAPELIQTLFTGLVAMLVVSAGIAFGLGGKEVAADILRDLQRKLKGE